MASHGGGKDLEITSYERSHKIIRNNLRCLHLQSYLDRLQNWAIYCDKDNIMFIQPLNETAPIETADNFGSTTSELRPTEFIEEFVSGGPKNYAYKIVHTATGKRKTVC